MTESTNSETPSVDEAVLACYECGTPVYGDQSPGVFLHEGTEEEDGTDLDIDHTAIPDWPALGEVPCATCGQRCQAEYGLGMDVFCHLDPDLDDAHAATPKHIAIPWLSW